MLYVYGKRNDEVKKGDLGLKRKMKYIKSIDEERKESGVYEGKQSMKTWANILQRG